MAKILVVEDEVHLAELTSNWLRRDHHLVEVVHDGDSALHQLKISSYDIVVLDWMLPSRSGIEVCKGYRSAGGGAWVIMVTAKEQLEDMEIGFQAGADDYITKPFQLKELSMRIAAHLRRTEKAEHSKFVIHDIEIDINEHEVRKHGTEVHLLPKEFRLLEFFVRHPHRVFSAEELLTAVWESDSLAQNDTVRGHVTRLRKKLDTEGKPSVIKTVHGVGYKLGED